MDKLKALLAQWVRLAKQLFHILVGVTFLFLAGAGATVSIMEWRYYESSPSVGLWRFDLLAGFTVLLLLFGLYSFTKARSVR